MSSGTWRALAPALFTLLSLSAWAGPTRVVVIKVDGLPGSLIEQLLQERDPRTGHSQLPWIEEVFGHEGAIVSNFYVRGISLSAPSWAMLDTGHHQLIHGNVEYDRYTLRSYDYLNFFPFYLGNASGKRADMPGVEVLDAAGVPLVIDRFPGETRYQSFQLFQRWVRWKSLQRSFESRFLSHSPRDLLDEFETGFELESSLGEETERELTAHLASPECLYLDLYSGDFDHLAHVDNNRNAQVAAIRRVDGLIGRIWAAIQNSPSAADTILALVSDHGINSVPETYSQGYSLVDWFRSPGGGAHHTATDRYPLDQYKIRGLNPLVSEVITASPDSTYLKDESQQYPTVFLDLDGNERAAIQLRNSGLNALHVLLKELNRKDLPPRLRQAALRAFFEIRDSRRVRWQESLNQLQEELGALRQRIAQARAELPIVAKRKWTPEELAQGLDQDERRKLVRLETWQQDERSYTEYARVMSNLLSIDQAGFDTHRMRIADLIPKRSLGEPNSIYDLQNYVVGPSLEGLQTRTDGELDYGESFRKLDYFAALRGIEVRNRVQKGVGTRPVDFIAARVPVPGVEEALWLYVDETHQALVLGMHRNGQLELRYVPVARLRGLEDGSVTWQENTLQAGLPLALCEDPALDTGDENRTEWLQAWHSDRDWLRATHRTRYSNGIIGVYEQFVAPEVSPVDSAPDGYEAHRRRLVEPDILLLASDHWNFNARGFNPGGNHGSFFRISTHSVLMFAGGEHTGIPRGLAIEDPYDSLSFAPTLLKLAGHEDPALPGPLIDQLFPARAIK